MLMEVQNLEKQYKTNISLIKRDAGKIKALKNINFTIGANEIVGVVGESGCGKSTLTRQLSRLEKPTEGKILFLGEDVNIYSKQKLKNYRKNCQLIFQNTMAALNPSMKIWQILNEPLNNYYNLNKEEKRKRILEMLYRVELDGEILNRYPHTLSGGERQRVNICRALLLEPKLLICDEIVSSLDVSIQTSILHLIKELNQDLDMAILFISHDIQVVKYLCDRILVMNKGEIVEIIDNRNDAFQITNFYTKQLFDCSPIRHTEKRII